MSSLDQTEILEGISGNFGEFEELIRRNTMKLIFGILIFLFQHLIGVKNPKNVSKFFFSKFMKITEKIQKIFRKKIQTKSELIRIKPEKNVLKNTRKHCKIESKHLKKEKRSLNSIH